MGQRDTSAVEGPPAPGRRPPPRDAFARQVRDALAHLHDLPHLQTSPLARQSPPARHAERPAATNGVGAPGPLSTGKALQRRLLAALAELGPQGVEAPGPGVRRPAPPAVRTRRSEDLRRAGRRREPRR